MWNIGVECVMTYDIIFPFSLFDDRFIAYYFVERRIWALKIIKII